MKLQKLVWGVPSFWIERLPVYFGRHQGLFRAQGIELEIRCFWGGPAVAAAVASGRAPIGEIGLPPLLKAAAEGLPARVIGSSAVRRLDHYLAARPRFQSLQDLRGRRIGILAAGSCDDYFLRRMLGGVEARPIPLRQAYGDLHCFTVRPPVGVPRIDAGFLVEPFLTLGESRGLVRVLAVVRNYFPVFQWGVLLAGRELLDRRRELARRALQAFRASCRAVAANPDQAAAFGAQMFRMPKEVFHQALLRDLARWELDARLDPEGMENCLRLQVELGAVPGGWRADRLVERL